MKLLQLVFLILLCAAVSAATALALRQHENKNSGGREPAFTRVMQSNTLRCAYFLFPPIVMRDPNTGALSGLSVDMMNHAAEAMKMKIEWTEQIDFANWQPGLQAGRYDAICATMWPEPALFRSAAFTKPMFYAGIDVYARGDDDRFDNNLDAVNSPDVTIAVIEGNALEFLARDRFPKAKILSLPQNSPSGLQAESVVTKKADVTLWDANGVVDFLKSNPGSIHDVAPGQPVKIMPFELIVNLGEDHLRDLLDSNIQSMQDTGYMNRLIAKWQRSPGAFYPVTQPYAMPAEAK